MRPPMTGNLLEIPFSKVLPSLMSAFAFSGFAIWANKAAFNVAPASLAPAFLAEAAEKTGIAERISAPPVFLDPISRGIPGSVRGPDDIRGEDG
ncbi:MAG: hypothetical protein J3K34DRAFT_464318 [Monoraphidium minutum]|nr:MAG: hypothetical protein J3K34DRAFT_464318 [Monoraphidium minutum]